jgi:hypothetical protein
VTDEAAHPFRLSRRGLLTGAAALAGATAGLTSARAATAAPAGLAVTSGNAQLVADYTWARQRALDWVQTGTKPGYIPCYWAGLTTRPAFYSRDFAHQALGAHLLGLDAENLSMLRTFANSATAARRWYPLWSFTFDGKALRRRLQERHQLRPRGAGRLRADPEGRRTVPVDRQPGLRRRRRAVPVLHELGQRVRHRPRRQPQRDRPLD